MKSELILWRGAKHSGKTAVAGELADHAQREGFRVAGLLAPAIYADKHLVGFEALDLRTAARALLAERTTNKAPKKAFTFVEAGLKLGAEALSSEATSHADLIILDEFGPLELAGAGWRSHADSLLADANAVVLLVVREQVARQVRKLYAHVAGEELDAARPSIAKVIEKLKNRRNTNNE
ncbi:MAG: nucleoside-triphosphatase [Planctomycetota bacterium]